MAALRRQSDSPPVSAGQTDDLRRMALLLETADVLAARARRTPDPARRTELMRRAGERRREATGMRESLVARGAALPLGRAAPSPARRTTFSPATPAVGTPRA
jgi:hypothetical protein